MKLFGFRWSPYAQKVKLLLELMGEKYEWVEVPYSDRTALATLTGGYIHVPVLQDGKDVVFDSRAICERLVAKAPRLVPSPYEGPIWAFHDFVDGPLEDVLFRIAAPAVRDGWRSAGDRALYVVMKERKFGAGCVDAWERDQARLIERAKHLLAPSLKTLAQQPFLFGEKPTLADCSLYGNCRMLEEGDRALLPHVAEPLVGYCRRLEASARS